MQELWYSRPATRFEEALPVGNGRLGGMYYAGVDVDKISLNEDTLWSGFPQDKSAKEPYDAICKAKALMTDGKVGEAENLLYRNALGEWTESYQPAGNLVITRACESEYSDYRRSLDISSAVAYSEFEQMGYKYSRKLFCSHPNNVMIYHYKASAPSEATSVKLESPHPYKTEFENGCLIMRSIAPSYAAPNYFKCDEPIRYDSFENNRALSYSVSVKPVLSNGFYSSANGLLQISSTDFYLIIAIATNFDGYDVHPKDSKIDPAALCAEQIAQAEKLTLDELLRRHISDYKSLFDRVSLFIEGIERSYLPTDERISAYEKDKKDVGLAVLLYDYARYITIASSREGSQATNLQGIWNEQLRAPWSSNYTLNINTQMNYWHVERSNLSECHLPLMTFISELANNGAKTAQKYYNARGWCAHHNSDIWRQSDPVGRQSAFMPICFGFWNMSGAWLALHIWEHFCYTNDVEFLKNNFEVLKGAALFLLDWLCEDEDGYLVTPLATSPENKYVLEDGNHALSIGCAMDQAIAAELFTACINAANALEIDGGLCSQLHAAREKLKPLEIDGDGCLVEWDKPLSELDPHHRHISLLFGLYPGNTVTESTPELLEASRKLLVRRGFESTGWGLAWRICTWSRLGDGNTAKRFVDGLIKLCESYKCQNSGGGIYPNLLAACPPFQIDATFGYAAGINEMLIQEKNGEPIPLPALPREWRAGGYVTGLKLSKNRTASIVWQDGMIINFSTDEA